MIRFLKNRLWRKAIVCGAGLALVLLGTTTKAQDTIWDTVHATRDFIHLPVTFYDFHSDKSNPEFENSNFTGKYSYLLPGLIMSTLDTARKPVKNPARGDTNCVNNIYKWYRSWDVNCPVGTFLPAQMIAVRRPGSFHRDSFPEIDSSTMSVILLPRLNVQRDPTCAYDSLYMDTVCTYDTTHIDTVCICDTLWHFYFAYLWDTTYTAETTLYHDTLFKNVPVADSIEIIKFEADTVLVYNPVDSGYDTSYYTNFFDINSAGRWNPLAKKGFDSDTSTRPNNDFTMELHNQFVYHAGQFIKMDSDDDSWAFINDTLRCDLGSGRSGGNAVAWLDSFHLTAGQTYKIDIFYAERLTGGHLSMASNLEWVNKTSGTKEVLIINPIVGVNQGFKSIVKADGIMLGLGNGFSITVPKATRSATIKVFNALGRQIYTQNVADISKAKLTTPKLHNGVFFVKAICRDKNGIALPNVFSRLMATK